MDPRSFLAPILAAGLCATSAIFAAAASAETPTAVAACGTTIATDAYLPHDLVCADGTGLRITAPVTLDLRGHALIGPGRDAASFGGSVGIDVDQTGAAPARVTNGTLIGWDASVRGTPPSSFRFDQPLRADHLRIAQAGIGIQAPLGGILRSDRVSTRDVDTAILAFAATVSVSYSDL